MHPQSAMNSGNRVGILIPALNSHQFLPELLARIADVQIDLPGSKFSVLIVDDGSQPPLNVLTIPGLEIELIRHPRNRGKGAALRTGFSHFLNRAEVFTIMTIDADLQHPPEQITAFLNTFNAGRSDIVIGHRSKNPGIMPWHRILSNTITSMIISMMIRQYIPDSQCGFRLYSRRVLEQIHLTEERFHLESEILIRAGWKHFQIASIPVPTIYNGAGSAIRHLPDTFNFITMLGKLIREKLTGNV